MNRFVEGGKKQSQLQVVRRIGGDTREFLNGDKLANQPGRQTPLTQ